MRSILTNIPTEKLILHKPSGDIFEVAGLVDSSTIFSDDVTIPIEINDYFERTLPNGVVEYYKVIDAGFYKGMHGIPDNYQTKVQLIQSPIVYSSENNNREKMIFISHSSKDKEYTKAFVDLLFAIGLNDEDIVCSSYPGLGVPLGNSIYEWLVAKFQECDLHVFYFLSHNYYKSAASLNEMGAAWAMKQRWDSILLPGFNYSDISGCLDTTQIGIKLDGDIDELKHRLGELKDRIVNEFALRPISATRWEKMRDNFIKVIKHIIPDVSDDMIPDVMSSFANSENPISVYACIMLMYAAAHYGKIMVVHSINGTSYQAGNTPMERSQHPRELAIWDDAVSYLIANGYIKRADTKGVFYQVTTAGYKVADSFKQDNELDINMSPSEILMEFGE